MEFLRMADGLEVDGTVTDGMSVVFFFLLIAGLSNGSSRLVTWFLMLRTVLVLDLLRRFSCR